MAFSLGPSSTSATASAAANTRPTPATAAYIFAESGCVSTSWFRALRLRGGFTAPPPGSVVAIWILRGMVAPARPLPGPAPTLVSFFLTIQQPAIAVSVLLLLVAQFHFVQP